MPVQCKFASSLIGLAVRRNVFDLRIIVSRHKCVAKQNVCNVSLYLPTKPSNTIQDFGVEVEHLIQESFM